MKTLSLIVLGVLGVMLVACHAQAQSTVHFTECSTMTIGTAALEVTGNTTTLDTSPAFHTIKVGNLDTAKLVYCSHSSSVTSSGNRLGDAVAVTASGSPTTWLSWTIAKVQGWYCVASAGNTVIDVCKTR